MKPIFICFFSFFSLCSVAQTSYEDSLKAHLQNYVETHAVVKGQDRKDLQFYPINKNYQVVGYFEKKENEPWFKMDASGPIKLLYRVYGVASFILDGKKMRLNVYQSQSMLSLEKYKDHLFIPFTDASSGAGSYSGGRYIDIQITDIKNNELLLDFNKAYNPYCAYVSGVYSCPIPPKENQLPVSVLSGEKEYSKGHH